MLSIRIEYLLIEGKIYIGQDFSSMQHIARPTGVKR